MFNQRIFNYFLEQHGLTLLQGEMTDIKNLIYDEIFHDLDLFSDDKLSDLFHAIIKEMNQRKAVRQGVDVGFWDSEGIYKEDVQKLEPQEAKEIFKGPGTSDLVVWFDSNNGEPINPKDRKVLEKRLQLVAQHFGFDFYFSSNLWGMLKKLKGLEQDGFFEDEVR